jgi:DNA-binding XRE family transcriptional regulator
MNKLRAWATGLSPDELDNYRRGNCTNDRWARAAKREAKKRGKCGAISRDGDVCHCVPGHVKTWHEVEVGPGGYNQWNYDMRTIPNGFVTITKYGKALRSIRREKRLTQEKLAVTCGLSKSYISHIEAERKRPTLDTLEAICKGLGIRVSEFVARAESKK